MTATRTKAWIVVSQDAFLETGRPVCSEEHARPRAAAREKVIQLAKQMREVTVRLGLQEAVLSWLEITREMMTEIVSGDGTATVAGSELRVPVCGGIAGRAGTALEARAGVVLPGSYSGIVGVLRDEVPGMPRRRGARIGAIRGSCRCG